MRISHFIATGRVVTPALLVVLATVTIYKKYPGLMGADAVSQYRQVTSGQFDDWQPPLMAWLWSVFDRIVPGSGPIFVLHAVLYWASFIVLAATFNMRTHRIAAVCLALIAIIPANLFQTFEITKDVGLAAAFLAAFGAIHWLRITGRDRIAASIAVLALIGYGSLVRTNAIFAAPPLIVYLFRPSLSRRPLLTLCICFVTMVALLPVGNFVNHRVIGARNAGAIRSLEVFDMAGIAVRTQDLSILVSDRSGMERLTRCYTPVLWDTLGTPGCDFISELGSDAGRRWITAIVAHPMAYLEHRLAYTVRAINTHFLQHVPQDQRYDWMFFLNVPPDNVSGQLFQSLLALVVFRPIFILVVCLASLSNLRNRLIRNSPEGILAFFLALSGLAYFLGYAVVGVASEFRYFLWCMLSLPVSLVASIAAMHQVLPRQQAVKSTWNTVGALIVTACLLQAVLPSTFYREIPDTLLDRRTGLPIPIAPAQ